jgi:23S rRNA (uracil1939-C5)-methyltransferase
MKSGEQYPVTILKMVSKGKGLARLEDRATFIPYVLPGEEVEIKIRQIKKDYLLADKISILSSSPFRVEPPCPLFEKCGGCQWQMADYSHQLLFKTELLKETLRRIGKLEPEVASPVPASDPFYYRQRVKFQTTIENGKVVIGFYRPESKEIVPIESCFIISPLLNRLLREVSLLLNKTPEPFSSLKEIHFSLSSAGQDIIIELNGKEISHHESIIRNLFNLPFQIKGIILTGEKGAIKVLGKRYLSNIIEDPSHPEKGIKIRSSSGGFSQVNWEMNLKLIETLLSWAKLSGKENVLELYCGNGNFTVSLAKECRKITAVEENPVALEDLRFNLQANQIANCSVRKGSAQTVLARWDRTKFPIDLLVLDPPREGVDHSSLQSVLKIRPARILYISCDPATLARDLKSLSTKYTIQRIAPFDMFPQTAHIETLTELKLSI